MYELLLQAPLMEVWVWVYVQACRVALGEPPLATRYAVIDETLEPQLFQLVPPLSVTE